MSTNIKDQGGDHDGCDRRVILSRLVKAGAATWAAGISAPALVYLWPARSGGPGEQILHAGQADQISVGEAKLVESAEKPVLVMRVGQDDYRALSAICTHLGCLVEWRKDKGDVFCPCHGGRFDSSGKVLGGPPPRPLASYPVTIRDGELEIDLTSKG